MNYIEFKYSYFAFHSKSGVRILSLESHLEKLRYFYEVAKAQSIKEGATHLNLTQPSVSKSIKILEESLNVKFFVRRSRGVSLTPQGQILFNYCHSLFAGLCDIEARILAPEEPMAGVVRVGTYDSIAIFFWPHFLKSFLKKYPLISLEMTTGRSRSIQKAVEQGELDLALIVEPKSSAGVESLTLIQDHFHFYASSSMTSEEILNSNTPLIFMPDALSGKNFKRLRHTLEVELHNRKQFKTSSLEAAKEMIVESLGVGLLPSLVARSSVQAGRIKKVDPWSINEVSVGTHDIGLIFPKHRKEWGLLKGLISEIEFFLKTNR